MPSVIAKPTKYPPGLSSAKTIDQLCEALGKTSLRPISGKIILDNESLDHFFNNSFTFKYNELTEPQKGQLAKYCYYRLPDEIPNENWPEDLKARILNLNQSSSATERNLKIMNDIILFKTYLIKFSTSQFKAQIVKRFNKLEFNTQKTICSNESLIYAAKRFIQLNTPRNTKKAETRPHQRCRAQTLKAKKNHEQKAKQWNLRKTIKK